MGNEDRKCPKCGGTEFLGNQACRGTLTVIVTVSKGGTAYFVRNNRNPDVEDNIDPNDLDFDEPEGPFECLKCGAILEDK